MRRSLLALLALCLATAPVLTQEAERPTENTPGAVPAPPPNAGGCDEEYRVGSGDRLEVVVFDNDDIARTAAVRPNGAISLPLVGDVSVGGATLAEIEERLTTSFAHYIVSPQVDVTVREYNSRFVALVGEVSQPGRRALGECTRVIDLLLQAGGFLDGASAEVVVSPGEGDGEVLQARIERGVFTPQARRVLQTVLRGGEMITVLPPAYVTVQGEVERPNRYPIEGRLTVTGAVSLAGGLTRSGSSKAKIVRTGEDGKPLVLEADLGAIRDGRAEDVTLQPEDIVTIPRRFF